MLYCILKNAHVSDTVMEGRNEGRMEGRKEGVPEAQNPYQAFCLLRPALDM